MKKFMYFGIAAIALSMAACSSDDEVAQPENFGEAVKAQFTISFPTKTGTRMTDDVVQNDPAVAKFRGMDLINLIPFGSYPNGGITAEMNRIGDNISLVSMLKPTETNVNNYIPKSVTNQNGLLTGSNAVLYKDVEVLVGTTGFLFYGKAIDDAPGTAASTDETMHKYGSLTAAGLTGQTPAGITFTPKPIREIVLPVTTVKKAITDYLNLIAGSQYTSGSETKNWKGTDNEAYQALYATFTGTKAGASNDVKALVQDLYETLYKNSDPLAQSICTNILTKASASVNNDGVLTFSWQDTSLDGYPADNKLPDGAAVLNFANDAFSYVETEVDVDNTGLNVAALADYVYPASLYYRANSPIKVHNASRAEFYVDNTTWDGENGILSKYTDGNSVKVNTKSIAITDPIQYAVGRLDMTVTVQNQEIKDSKETVIPIAGLPVSAILIGGQKPVNFLFQPTTGKTYTIYDNTFTGDEEIVATKTATSAVHHTLVLENGTENVFIALEFTNNTGADFYGQNGRVPAGCKFYLVGELNPTNGTPAVEGGAALGQVFKQDYITYVNFTIKDLKKAYNVIPDLTAPQLELGLSVDLTWQQGDTYAVELKAE